MRLRGIGAYLGYFLLYPVGEDILAQAVSRERVFRAWKKGFNLGHAPTDSHPMLGENDPAYRERHEWLEDQVKPPLLLPAKYEASFRATPGQEALPLGVMRELEVRWSAMAA